MNVDINREITSPYKVVSEYFSNKLVMDESSKEKQSTSKKPQAKSDKPQKRITKRVKGQKDIRTLIKSKKNELLVYTKDFDLICKQSGIDVDPEQLQLAIALSKSLQDHKSVASDIPTADKPLTCNQRKSKIRTTLQEYGFQAKNVPSKKIKKYRKHYKLNVVSVNEKHQKIADKYAQILIRNVCISINEENFYKPVSNDSYLYNLTTNVTYDCIRDNEVFYVNNLVPKSLHKNHTLKDWSQIPGRPVSPKFQRDDISFKGTECSQEELDNVLSGSIQITQDIIQRNCKSNSLEVVEKTPHIETGTKEQNSVEIELKGLGGDLCKKKTNEDMSVNKSFDVESNNFSNNMSPPTSRCYSPDLFDDEVTIILDNSKATTLQDSISEKTVMVKEQNDFMELTDCAVKVNDNYSISNDIALLSQDSNRTMLNSNDLMDLTECVPSYSQKSKRANKNYTVNEQTQNLISENIASNHSMKKSSDDTIIMIGDDYSNVNEDNKYITANMTLKENSAADLVGHQCKESELSSATVKHKDSVIDLDLSPENISEKLNNSDRYCITSLDQHRLNSEENCDSAKGNIHIGTVDLTQPSNKEDCLSPVNITSTKYIYTYDDHIESDSEIGSVSTNSDHTTLENINDIENERLEKCKKLEAMDLTQTSDSEDCLKDVLHETIINKSLDDTIIINSERYNLIVSANNDLKNGEDVVDLCNELDPLQEKNTNISQSKSNTINHTSTILDSDNDVEYDKLIENASNSKKSNGNSLKLLDITTIGNEPECEHLDLTQNYRTSSHELSPLKNLTVNSRNINGEIRSASGFDENTSNYQFEDVLKYDHHTEHSDIDLTQKSGSSEDILSNAKNIEIADELENVHDISVAYDDICNADSLGKYYETTSPCDINKSVENDTSCLQQDIVFATSQHSEVFEISDNEFNYSVNQHRQENDSLEPKQAKFDIGGMSIIDEFLSRNSISRRSKVNYTCSSNHEANTIYNEVESYSPSYPLKNNDNLGNNVTGESKSCEDIEFIKISTPFKSRSEDNILLAKTPKHDDYIIKTDQVTPMPNYEYMTSPERNEELDKFGIKPLKRKRAIQILTHIYNQTHPVMEVLPNDEHSSPSKIRRKNNVEGFPRRAITSQIDSVLERHSPEIPESSYHVLDALEPNVLQTSPRACKNMSRNQQTSPRKKRISDEISRKDNNLYKETTLIPDIRNIECSAEDWAFQKREKAKVHSCRVPLHIAFHNYVSSRSALREAILRYEPINIDDVHKGLVNVGYRYNPKDLLKFMDRKCITVKTADNTRKNKNA